RNAISTIVKRNFLSLPKVWLNAHLLTMIIHLVDGTYELFRHFYGIRRFKKTDPPFGAVSGVLATVAQLLEDGLVAMGVVVWPEVELEADDALASAAYLAAQDERVEKVCIWTPDKDLAQ